MPELPEVETIRKDLIKKVLKKTILAIEVFDARVIRSCEPKVFIEKIKGKTIVDITRRGKAIIFHLVSDASKNRNPQLANFQTYLVVQVMMTGHFIAGKKLTSQHTVKATKVSFQLSNDTYLNYNDQRLFGRLNVVDKLEDFPFFQMIGPEPFADDFTVEGLRLALKRREVAIKTLLLQQNIVAGIGNIYASEILFRCGISPKRRGNRLKLNEISAIRDKTREVLLEAIEARGTSMLTYRDSNGEKGNFIRRIKVYGRKDEACFQCSKPILRIVQQGRSTFYCRHCQK